LRRHTGSDLEETVSLVRSRNNMVSSWLLALIPSNLWYRALLSCSLASVLTVILETTCLEHVRKIRSTNAGRALHTSAWYVSSFNNVVLGTATYYTTVRYVCHPTGSKTLQEQVMAAAGVVVIEAFLYYLVHKAFHEVKGLYWMHKYHHGFSEVVLPSAANAVSIFEYTIAYMMPLMVGALLTQADEAAAVLGATVVAISNLFLHTPWLATHEYPHWIFVSASDHLSHHRNLKGNYGAPVFHVDRIVERCASFQLVDDSSSKPKAQ